MELYPGQTRLYVIVGTMLGLMIGVFMQSSLDIETGAFRAAWLAIFSGIGAVIGKLLVVAQAPEKSESEPQSAQGDDPEVSATRFFKLQSGVYSDEELRRLRVRAVTMPMSPPDAEVPLQVRDYDHYVRVPVVQGVLARMTVGELADRARAEAENRAPKVPGDLSLSLVSFNSEGAVRPGGFAPLGWTFSFVDGAHGLGCRATATGDEIALHFHTAATFSAPADWSWIRIAEVIGWVAAAMPAWAERDVHVRVNLADDYLVYVRNPLRIADLDVRTGRVLNEAFLRSDAEPERAEEITLDELLEWFRGGEASGDLLEALREPGFADALRTMRPDAIRRVADALERASGAAIVGQLSAAVAGATDAAERDELLHLLSYLPVGLASVALHRFASDPNDAALSSLAAELHRKWRRLEIDVPRHPLDRLSFLESRRCMGRGNLVVVPLAPTYDPEGELLPVLTEMGFRIRRRRMLSGDANLLVGAHLRSDESDAELVLTSTPLPVPCHVLHIVGPGADKVADRVRRSKINYPKPTIIADVHSGKTSRVHRAALYVAALRIDESHLTPHLITAYERGRQSDALRKAVLSALGVQTDNEALDFLAAIALEPNHPDMSVASLVLRRDQPTGSVPGV